MKTTGLRIWLNLANAIVTSKRGASKADRTVATVGTATLVALNVWACARVVLAFQAKRKRRRLPQRQPSTLQQASAVSRSAATRSASAAPPIGSNACSATILMPHR